MLSRSTCRWVAVFGLAWLMLVVASAVAAEANRRAPQLQLLRHPLLRSEVALPLSGSRILLGGTLRHESTGLAVIRSNGSLDRRFGRRGLATPPGKSSSYFFPEEFGDPVAVDKKGRILLVEPSGGAIMRLRPNGTPDRSFGSDGVAKVDFGRKFADVTSVAVQPDGKIVVGGGSECSYGGCAQSPALARLTEAGGADPTFGEGGHEILSGSYRGEEPRVMGLTTDAEGEIFAVSGGYASDLTIQRFGADGTLDRSFGRRGSVIVGQAHRPPGNLFALPKIVVMPNGRVVVAGHLEHAGLDEMVAFRYLADGRPDPSFGQGGRAILATSVAAFTWGLAVRPDGGVVLSGDGVGRSSRYFLLAALRPDGRPDYKVGPGGFAKVSVGTRSSAPALILQGRTAVVVGSTSKRRQGAERTLLARIPLSP